MGVAVVAGSAAVVARLPGALLVPVMIVLLAGVDIVGAIAAKSWAHTPQVWMFLIGSAIYILLFWIYAQSLRHGELTTVTVGWVVVVTVASMLLDRFRYGADFPLSKWLAAGAIVALLCYLMVDTGSGTDRETNSPRQPLERVNDSPSTPTWQPGDVPSALN
jgi:multidrug transporter EmrE-like cation transporter